MKLLTIALLMLLVSCGTKEDSDTFNDEIQDCEVYQALLLVAQESENFDVSDFSMSRDDEFCEDSENKTEE